MNQQDMMGQQQKDDAYPPCAAPPVLGRFYSCSISTLQDLEKLLNEFPDDDDDLSFLLSSEEENRLFCYESSSFHTVTPMPESPVSSTPPPPPLPHHHRRRVFTESEVKDSRHPTTNDNDDDDSTPIFFIAGRGGETNYNDGNDIFRNRVLQYTQQYLEATGGGDNDARRGGGKAFVHQLMYPPNKNQQSITHNVCFVVRQSYFAKNCNNNNKTGNNSSSSSSSISQKRQNSVLREHAPRTLQDLCTNERSNHYLSIGDEWITGIITDLLRTAATKYIHKKRHNHPTTTCSDPSLIPTTNKKQKRGPGTSACTTCTSMTHSAATTYTTRSPSCLHGSDEGKGNEEPSPTTSASSSAEPRSDERETMLDEENKSSSSSSSIPVKLNDKDGDDDDDSFMDQLFELEQLWGLQA